MNLIDSTRHEILNSPARHFYGRLAFLYVVFVHMPIIGSFFESGHLWTGLICLFLLIPWLLVFLSVHRIR